MTESLSTVDVSLLSDKDLPSYSDIFPFAYAEDFKALCWLHFLRVGHQNYETSDCGVPIPVDKPEFNLYDDGHPAVPSLKDGDRYLFCVLPVDELQPPRYRVVLMSNNVGTRFLIPCPMPGCQRSYIGWECLNNHLLQKHRHHLLPPGAPFFKDDLKNQLRKIQVYLGIQYECNQCKAVAPVLALMLYHLQKQHRRVEGATYDEVLVVL